MRAAKVEDMRYLIFWRFYTYFERIKLLKSHFKKEVMSQLMWIRNSSCALIIARLLAA